MQTNAQMEKFWPVVWDPGIPDFVVMNPKSQIPDLQNKFQSKIQKINSKSQAQIPEIPENPRNQRNPNYQILRGHLHNGNFKNSMF